MGRKKDVFSFFQAQAGVDVAGLDGLEVIGQDLGHGGAGHVGSLFGQAAVRQVAAGVFGVGEVDVGDDVHDAAVGLLGQALVLAAVAGLHVEDRDVEALGSDDGQAGVGVAQDQDRVGLKVHHGLVGGGDDVAHGLAQVGADGIQIELRIRKSQVFEKDSVQVVVVVLAGMDQDGVKVFAAFFDDCRETDDLRAGAHDDHQFDLSVIFPHLIISCFNHSILLWTPCSPDAEQIEIP